jgi:hypothetical protein
LGWVDIHYSADKLIRQGSLVFTGEVGVQSYALKIKKDNHFTIDVLENMSGDWAPIESTQMITCSKH